MSTEFKMLFSLSVNHEYYGGLCPDFSFLWPVDSALRLKRGRLLSKTRKGRLYCLFAADSNGAPQVELSKERLIIALKPNNPYFEYFTQTEQTDDGIGFYSNDNTPQSLSLKASATLIDSILSHIISQVERPVSVRLKNRSGSQLGNQTIAEESQTLCRFKQDELEPGLLLVTESYPSGRQEERYYYYEPGLDKTGVFALIEIALHDVLYQNAASFNIDFSAKEDTLKYYIVAKNYSDSDFSQLTISDQGFAEQSRSQITFSRVPASDFSTDEIDAGLLHDVSDKITLFKSQTPVKRRQSAFKRIQLARNGEVLIANLPVPAQDKVRRDVIIHLARP
jgi:hypothetical protein